MNDGSNPDEQGLDWDSQFEYALWLRTADSAKADRLLRQLADETDDRKKKSLCLVWLGETGLWFKDCPNQEAATALLKLADEIMELLNYDPNAYSRCYWSDRLLMRALLVRARAFFALGNSKECLRNLCKAIEFMPPEDGQALTLVAESFAWDLNWVEHEPKVNENLRNQWNCPRRHTGPWECSLDPECPRPTADDQRNYLVRHWDCPRRHTPFECDEDFDCPGADPWRVDRWSREESGYWQIINGEC